MTKIMVYGSIAIIALLLVNGRIHPWPPQETAIVQEATLPVAVPHAVVAPQSVQEKVESEPYPPETVAALAQFGLSPDQVLPIHPEGKLRRPIILSNPLMNQAANQ